MYSQIARNKRNTWIVMFTFVLLLGIIGAGFAYAFRNSSIFFLTLLVSIIYTIIQFGLASKLVILASGAQKANKSTHRRLYHIVEELTITAGLPMPVIYVIDDPAPNAFASGRNPEHSMVAVTTGLLKLMDDTELRAVMAHEISHIQNYDIRLALITFALVAIIGFICDFGLHIALNSSTDDEKEGGLMFLVVLFLSLLAPIAASMLQLAISRQREYLADISAVKLTRYPEGMIAALRKLETNSRPLRRQNSAMSAFYINHPLKPGVMSKLFSTHPPIADRIKSLENAKTTF